MKNKLGGGNGKSPDWRDGRIRAVRSKGPPWRPEWYLLVNLIPDFESTPEWQETLSSPYFGSWRDSPIDMERVKGAVADRIIRRLRDQDVRTAVASGDPFWIALATNVVRSPHRWHQSTRIQLSAMRSMRRRLEAATLETSERTRLQAAISDALLRHVDLGVGEEFRPMALVARAVATDELIAGLEERARTATTRSVRINAQRMLDCVGGKPFRRYLDCL